MNNTVKRTWMVYGKDGHRQRESFRPSHHHDFSVGNIIRRINVMNADITGHYEYTVVEIERNTAEECERELMGQISDGIFENSAVGRIEEVIV